MGKEAKAISKKNIILWALLSGFIATLVMTSFMFVGRSKLGVPFIPELIAQRFSPSVTSEFRYNVYGIPIHLAIGTFCGFCFIYFASKTKTKRLTVAVLLYSIFLWVAFSALALPILGFGFFGKYLAGIPVTSEAAFLIYYVLFGLTLYPFTEALKK
ncbi:MAG: hypothetical protein ACRENF_03360 [Thermodesulfobacteriota bacterium]